MSKAQKTARTYTEIKADYAFDPSVFNADDERVRRIKYIIDTKLNQVDKTIILLYADLQSFRELGKLMGLSHTTIRKEVIRIKNYILNEYNSMKK